MVDNDVFNIFIVGSCTCKCIHDCLCKVQFTIVWKGSPFSIQAVQLVCELERQSYWFLIYRCELKTVKIDRTIFPTKRFQNFQNRPEVDRSMLVEVVKTEALN